MTEVEWLTSNAPGDMLFIQDPVQVENGTRRLPELRLRWSISPRKFRLYCCALWRYVWPLIGDAEVRQMVEALEETVDEPATSDRQTTIWSMYCSKCNAPTGCSQSKIESWVIAVSVMKAAEMARNGAPVLVGGVWRRIRTEQADLLRHIIGNPFHPLPAAPVVPGAVRELANSLYASEPCAFALHDALLEAGQAELAAHFREPSHPRGCWALDLILGKA